MALNKDQESQEVEFEKEEPKKKTRRSGNGNVMEILQQISNTLVEHSEQIAELAEKDATGQAKLLIASIAYNTPPHLLPELSRIPLTMVDPMTTDAMIDALLDEDVLSGAKSLGQVEREMYLKLMRSVGGEHLKKARETAEEERAGEGDQSGAEYRLGQE